jgi:hypothetical protein
MQYAWGMWVIHATFGKYGGNRPLEKGRNTYGKIKVDPKNYDMNWIKLVQDGVQPIQILYYLSKCLPKKNPTVWKYLVQQFFVLNKADILQPLCLT